ncbi:MAG: cysteine synthase A [candidate division Zixibacteria bacterium]|nr:cysteine synthase A [candidate division Zixibacteria bacterium]MDH3938128.1 cysteine synthase A [candidate division Zixibacteria bacterium]MDH4033297.1 cysteine synthase A [candidate division Zixibacteria bacterium]
MRFDNIAEAVGRTPIVRINRLTSPGSATLYVKLESFNPCGSVKDRIGVSMIEAAEKDGQLKSGVTIVEPTSGNTGIALAMVAAAKGYSCVFTMPETMSVERRAILKMFGAKIVLTPGPEGMKGAISKAAELAEQEGFFQPEQFSNPANPDVHKRTTGVEIINDLDGLTLDAFVAGVGTGGTVSGAGAVLKDKYGCQVVAVEPDASPVLSGGDPGPHPIQGIGAGFVPKNYDAAVVDEVVRVKNEDALSTSRALAAKEGILVGISSGAIVWAALQVAAKLGEGKTVVTVTADTGERYLSTALFEHLE